MENRKSLILILAFSLPFGCFAYDGETTHQALTQEAIKLFQVNYPAYNFSDSEISIIEKGSFLEDDPSTRCLKHFFDPIHNKGLYFNKTSKDWAQNTAAQASVVSRVNSFQDYFSSKVDYSWERGIYEYVHGDKERGLETLGHIIHLIQDKSVPDHTRLDNHYYGSPYEIWTKQFTKENIDIASFLIKQGKKPILYSNLDSYFDNLAKYSNTNFFSLDTVFGKDYLDPKIKTEETFIIKNGNKKLFGMGVMTDDNNYKLVQINRFRNLNNGTLETNYVFDDMDHLVVADYWNLLSKQAVLNSAGVIKLFFDKVEEEKMTKTLLNKNKSFFKKTLDSLTNKTQNLLSMVGLAADNSQIKLLPEIDELDSLDETPTILTDKDLSVEKQQEHLAIREMYRILLDLEKQIENIKIKLALEQSSPRSLSEETALVNQRAMSTIRSFASGVGALDEVIEKIVEDISPATTSEAFVLSPVVTSPINLNQPFGTTTITFSGTASSGQIIFTDISSASTTVDLNGDWSLTISELVEGTNILNFFAKDSNQNISDPLKLELMVELETEKIVTLEVEVEECQNSFWENNCVIGKKDQLNFSWTLTGVEGNHYQVVDEYLESEEREVVDEQGNTNWEIIDVVKQDIITTTDLTEILVDVPESFSQLKVLAFDVDNNLIASSTVEVIFADQPIVINELALNGTTASNEDKWIELYNPLKIDVDLDGIVINNSDNSLMIPLSGIIKAGDYFLIEQGDDEVVDVEADLVTDFMTGEAGDFLPDFVWHLRIIKNINEQEFVLDETPENLHYCLEESYCVEPAEGEYRSEYLDYKNTIERMWSWKNGTDISNWSLNSRSKRNGHDRSGGIIKGTPKEINSSSVPVLY